VIIYWNTLKLGEAVAALSATGSPIALNLLYSRLNNRFDHSGCML
jgi:hypothetical protein